VATATAPESVSNTYVGIDDLNVRMGITGTSNDGGLWMTLSSASRAVDRYCNRHFFVLEETRLFDIDDPAQVTIPDLVSVTELLEDLDGDRVFETTRSASDYALYPLNASPGSESGRPYGRIRSDLGNTATEFARGRSRVSIEGRWGYRFQLADTGSTVNSGGGISASVTIVAVDAVTELEAGMTIVIDDEQMFVRLVSGTNATVKRGQNGSTATTHVDTSVISFVSFPSEVVEATALLASRYWKSKDATSGGFAGVSGFAPIRVRSGIDSEIEQLLAPLRKLPIGVGV